MHGNESVSVNGLSSVQCQAGTSHEKIKMRSFYLVLYLCVEKNTTKNTLAHGSCSTQICGLINIITCFQSPFLKVKASFREMISTFNQRSHICPSATWSLLLKTMTFECWAANNLINDDLLWEITPHNTILKQHHFFQFNIRNMIFCMSPLDPKWQVGENILCLQLTYTKLQDFHGNYLNPGLLLTIAP